MPKIIWQNMSKHVNENCWHWLHQLWHETCHNLMYIKMHIHLCFFLSNTIYFCLHIKIDKTSLYKHNCINIEKFCVYEIANKLPSVTKFLSSRLLHWNSNQKFVILTINLQILVLTPNTCINLKKIFLK